MIPHPAEDSRMLLWTRRDFLKLLGASNAVAITLPVDADDGLLRPDFQLELIRPLDLLRLRLEGFNLQPTKDGRSLERISYGHPAYLAAERR